MSDNDSAFPMQAEFRSDGELITAVSLGLTKREYFAAMAMQGLCANSIPGRHHHSAGRATEAVECADMLLVALSKAGA